jgi:hypothetical protein
MHHPLTVHEARSVLLTLTLLAALTAALLWGTGCTTTPNDCMLTATCANQRLLKAGIDSRVAIVHTDTVGDHAIVVWRVPRSRNLWVYDGQGSYESGAVDFGETNELANTITCRYFLPTQWGRWVGP